MTEFRYSQILLAMPILLLCTGTAFASGNTLTAASTAVSLSYQLPGTPGSSVSVAFTATSAGTFFYVDSGMTNWLTVTQNGTAGTTANTTPGNADLITFQANAVAGTLAPGTYTTNVVFRSSATGTPTATVAVTLWVKEVAPTFTVSVNTTSGTMAGTTSAPVANLTWSSGTTSYPTLTIACTSSNDPISYSIVPGTTGLGTSMSLDHPGGVAYTWGSATSTLSFTPLTLMKAAIGTTLTGTVTVTPVIGGVSGTPTAITVNVAIIPAAVNITSLSPAELPVAASGNATVVVNGSGFVTGTNATVVKISLDGGSTWQTPLDSSKINVVNPNTMVLTLEAATYTAAAQTLTINASDTGVTGNVSMPITVTANPIIYSVTNSGSYVPASGNTQVAGYELISIFGANFDSTGSTPIVNALNSLGMYPTTVNNTAGNAVTVSFMQGTAAAATGTDLGDAPLLFVTNNQINAIVPAALAGVVGTNAANIVVNVASVGGNDATLNPFNVDAVAAVPGIFTPSGSGRGAAAVLNSDWSLNTLANPATHGTGVHIYATGLGKPTSTAKDDGTVSSLVYPGSCIDPAEYMKVLNGVTPPPTTPLGGTAGSALSAPSPLLTSIDGAVLQTANIYSNVYAPCFAVSSSAGVQVKLGTAAAINPTYAGFVMGSVAGLYQIDVTLPGSFTPAPVPSTGGPIVLAITVGSGTVTSQTGVTIYVK